MFIQNFEFGQVLGSPRAVSEARRGRRGDGGVFIHLRVNREDQAAAFVRGAVNEIWNARKPDENPKHQLSGVHRPTKSLAATVHQKSVGSPRIWAMIVSKIRPLWLILFDAAQGLCSHLSFQRHE